MGNLDNLKSDYICNQCGAAWNEDDNGLVPNICLNSKDWYGYWSPELSHAGVLGCPTCNEGAWKWHVDADDMGA